MMVGVGVLVGGWAKAGMVMVIVGQVVTLGAARAIWRSDI